MGVLLVTWQIVGLLIPPSHVRKQTICVSNEECAKGQYSFSSYWNYYWYYNSVTKVQITFVSDELMFITPPEGYRISTYASLSSPSWSTSVVRVGGGQEIHDQAKKRVG